MMSRIGRSNRSCAVDYCRHSRLALTKDGHPRAAYISIGPSRPSSPQFITFETLSTSPSLSLRLTPCGCNSATPVEPEIAMRTLNRWACIYTVTADWRLVSGLWCISPQPNLNRQTLHQRNNRKAGTRTLQDTYPTGKDIKKKKKCTCVDIIGTWPHRQLNLTR